MFADGCISSMTFCTSAFVMVTRRYRPFSVMLTPRSFPIFLTKAYARNRLLYGGSRHPKQCRAKLDCGVPIYFPCEEYTLDQTIPKSEESTTYPNQTCISCSRFVRHKARTQQVCTTTNGRTATCDITLDGTYSKPREWKRFISHSAGCYSRRLSLRFAFGCASTLLPALFA